MLTYKSSTFFRAQGVLRRNARLDLMLGSNLKHRMSIMLPRSSHPKCSTSSVTIISRVFPCSGSLGGIKSGIQKPNIREMMKSGIQQPGNPAIPQASNPGMQIVSRQANWSAGKLATYLIIHRWLQPLPRDLLVTCKTYSPGSVGLKMKSPVSPISKTGL
jgi:hypothetical protein